MDGCADRLLLNAVGRARTGDEDALRFLYLRYRDNVYGYVCSIVRDENDAEDVTQQIFARLPKALGNYKPRQVPFSGWILRVAHNAAVDHVRIRRPVPCEDVRPVTEVDRDDSRERRRDLRMALDALTDDQRRVVFLRYIVGMTPAEVAVDMRRSEDAVHGLQSRARRTLKAELSRLNAGPSATAAHAPAVGRPAWGAVAPRIDTASSEDSPRRRIRRGIQISTAIVLGPFTVWRHGKPKGESDRIRFPAPGGVKFRGAALDLVDSDVDDTQARRVVL